MKRLASILTFVSLAMLIVPVSEAGPFGRFGRGSSNCSSSGCNSGGCNSGGCNTGGSAPVTFQDTRPNSDNSDTISSIRATKVGEGKQVNKQLAAKKPVTSPHNLRWDRRNVGTVQVAARLPDINAPMRVALPNLDYQQLPNIDIPSGDGRVIIAGLAQLLPDVR